MMETPSLSRYVDRKSKRQCSSVPSLDEVKVIEVTESSSSSYSNSKKKLKQVQVFPDEIIEIDGDEDPAGVPYTSEKFNTDNKGKATSVGYGWENGVQHASTQQFMFPTSEAAGLMIDDALNFQKSLSTELYNLDDADLSVSDYEIDESYYEDDFQLYGDPLSLQPTFDAVDIPPGMEAPIPWLEQPTNSRKKTPHASSSTTVSNQLSFSNEGEDEASKKFRLFKSFDTVKDSSDHHYRNKEVTKSKQASQRWTKAIQQDWRILEKDLPDTIFVRVYEERMDLLRAVIIGAAGTPYHDGLFFFDVFFPSNYPDVPPQVHYHAHGLRLNPNLYKCGKVCLSLLNTWSGNKDERWTPKSTMLQVLLSIQALVLNAKPYFNEPGYERTAGKVAGEKSAQTYNENTFILSCRTMLYTLQNPPKYFEDFVFGHFRNRAYTILVACKAYIEGAQVGCVVEGGVQDVDEGDKSGSLRFKNEVVTMAGNLVPVFLKNGAKNCEQFIPIGDCFRLSQANCTNIPRWSSSYKMAGEAQVASSKIYYFP